MFVFCCENVQESEWIKLIILMSPPPAHHGHVLKVQTPEVIRSDGVLYTVGLNEGQNLIVKIFVSSPQLIMSPAP